MWGTSSPEDKLAGDLGNVIGATSIGGRRYDFFTARNLGPGNLGLLQQYLAITGLMHCSKLHPHSITSLAVESSVGGTIRPSTSAVLRLTGQAEVYDAVPCLWSNQYDLRPLTVGLSIGMTTSSCADARRHELSIVRCRPSRSAFRPPDPQTSRACPRPSAPMR
jgi:hypothetical protein